MKGVLRFLSGFVWGSLVGATAALLFAPSSGEELRIQLQERADQIEQEVKQAADTRRVELEHQLAELRSPNRTNTEM